MKRKKITVIMLTLIITMMNVVGTFAAKLDPSIPSFDANKLALASDGTATFTGGTIIINGTKVDTIPKSYTGNVN